MFDRGVNHSRGDSFSSWKRYGQMLKMLRQTPRRDRARDCVLFIFFKGLRLNAAKEFRAHPLQAYSIR